MPDRFIQKAQRLDVAQFKKPRDLMAISRTHVSFSGSLQKHPVDPNKVVLIPDPHSADQTYVEFNRGDIRYLEKLPGITLSLIHISEPTRPTRASRMPASA